MSTSHGSSEQSAASSPRYEFTSDQNTLIGKLAGKMGFVGYFAILAGLINLLIAILLTTAIYKDEIPQEWKDKTAEYLRVVREKLPEDIRAQTEEYSLEKVPPNSRLWGSTLNSFAISVFLLLLGIWTCRAGGSFRKIVKSKGEDMKNLMEGLDSLHSMYSLFYTILLILLLIGLSALAFSLYKAFGT